MATTDRTGVIDPEFGYYGPMGFDIGSFLANLFMSFFSQVLFWEPAYEFQGGWQEIDQENDREIFAQWLLKTIEAVWDGFATKFKSLWDKEHEGTLWI